MGHTLYSHALRILTCAQCGAPIDASIHGGSFPCGYCAAVCQLARRDESADISAARAAASATISESERYARLREQDRNPPPLPPGIAALLVEGHLPPANVPRAEADWLESRAQLATAPSFPVCERFFHLTVVLAPQMEERRRRASLETAVELLPDDGHRHVLRCMLAREAARAGDFASADLWLEPVSPRAMDLGMDTSYRLAAATLASARGDHRKVTELLGFRRDDVPLADRDEVACWILRVDALEHIGREADAVAEVTGWITTWGAERMRQAIAAHLPLRLCERSFATAHAKTAQATEAARRAYTMASVAGLEGQIAEAYAKPTWLGLVVGFFLTTFLLAFGLGTAWTCVVTGMVEADPLFGAHARMVCPRVCDDCRAPYEFASWTTTTNNSSSDSTLNIYCNDDGGRIASIKGAGGLWSAAVGGEPWLARYEVRGGVWYVGLTLILLWLPIAAVLALALLLRGWIKRRQLRAELEAKLAQERARL